MAFKDKTKLACSIDFDDEWTQEDCHWKYDRVFIFSYKVDSSVRNSRLHLYYRFSQSDDFTEIPIGNCKLVNNTYYYSIKLSDPVFAWIMNKRDSVGHLSVEIKATGRTLVLPFIDLEATAAYLYDYVLPPSSENLDINLTRKSADNIICSWNRPEDLLDNPSVAGYSIELFCKKKDTDTFIQYKNLGWAVYPDDCEDETLRGQFVTDNEGSRKLTKITNNSDPALSNVPGEISFKGIGSSYELRTRGPGEISFFFRPRDFDIQKDDFFMIKVYPYVVYGSYFDGTYMTPGTLLASESEKDNETDGMEFKLGVVRVKTDSGWVEGQVWVMTETGWKEADSIYTKTADGWKESI